MGKTISTFLYYFLISFITSFSPKHFICALNKFVHNSVVPTDSVRGPRDCPWSVHGLCPWTVDVDAVVLTRGDLSMDVDAVVLTTGDLSMDSSTFGCMVWYGRGL